MTNLLTVLHRRELTSSNGLVRKQRRGPRQYHLFKILPKKAFSDVFLGFSVCGQFLVSYRSNFRQFSLRFWIFPPTESSSVYSGRLQLFAEANFSRMTYASRFQDMMSVRFIQSILDPTCFFILACDYNGNGLITAFCSLPNLECDQCILASAKIYSDGNSSQRTSCTVHMQVLLLNLDLPSVSLPVSVDNGYSDESHTKRLRSEPTHTCPTEHIPPCFRNFSSSNTATSNCAHPQATRCACFGSTCIPIGLVHVTVCPFSGRMQVVWPSPDSQVKAISCFFDSENPAQTQRKVLHLFPQGTSTFLTPGPLAFRSPLLTQNYCSTCYSWPHFWRHPCDHSQSHSVRSVGSPRSADCVFAQQARGIEQVSDPNFWPDNHCFHQNQDCVTKTGNPNYHTRCKSGVARSDFHYPAFFVRRPLLSCCSRLTYLAMLQDIRASYLQWMLISRPPVSHVPHSRTELVTSEPSDVHSLDDSLSTASHTSSDSEDIALALSPASAEVEQSPEDLLAHRLSGLSHTSFDVRSWAEIVEPVVERCESEALNRLPKRAVARLEEAVFDIPSSTIDDLPVKHSELFVFIPPEEESLVLVYRYTIDLRSMTSFELVDAIDLSTGDRLLLLDSAQADGPYRRRFSSILSRLAVMVDTCPMLKNGSSNRRQLTHELNNMQMTFRTESLTLLVDCQGGYAVHL